MQAVQALSPRQEALFCKQPALVPYSQEKVQVVQVVSPRQAGLFPRQLVLVPHSQGIVQAVRALFPRQTSLAPIQGGVQAVQALGSRQAAPFPLNQVGALGVSALPQAVSGSPSQPWRNVGILPQANSNSPQPAKGTGTPLQTGSTSPPTI